METLLNENVFPWIPVSLLLPRDFIKTDVLPEIFWLFFGQVIPHNTSERMIENDLYLFRAK